MNIGVFIFSVLAMQGICWAAAKWSARGVSTKLDYFLSGRDVGFFPLMMTFLATQVGGGLVLGAAQEASRVGWWVVVYPLGQVLGMMSLSMGIGKRLAGFGVPTVAQIFEVFYGSPVLKRIASSLSIVSLFMILVAQMLASKSFLLSLGVDNTWLFMAAWGLLIVYTATGGLKGVIATDLIQAVFFIVIFGVAFGVAYGMGGMAGTVDVQEAPVSLGKLSGWLLMPLCFAALEQDMGQRCFAAKSDRVLNRAAFVAACVTFVVCLVPIYFGMIAGKMGIEGANGSSVLMSAVQLTTSPVVSALVGCAVIAAILSTANSLLNAISSNLSQDFAFTRDQSLNRTQWITGAIGVAAIFVTYFFNNIVDLMIQAYELSVCCVFVPLIAALFKKSKGNWMSAALSMGFGAGAFFLFRLYPIELPREVTALGLSLVGYGVGEAIAYSKRGRKLRVID
jgi:SSS family solute:Na+ symporter